MDEQDMKAKILYLCREKLYTTMLSACQDGVSKFRNDRSFTLYHALALTLCNRFEESISEFESLKQEQNFHLSVVVGLMYAYRLMGSSEKELFLKLDAQVREYKKRANGCDLYCTAVIVFAFKKYEKALDYVDRSLKEVPNAPESLCLKGWIELYLKRTGISTKAEITEVFESSLLDNKRNLDGALGLAESFINKKKYEEALSTLNKLVVRYPSDNIPLVQKMKLHFATQDWDQVTETINRIKNTDPDSLEAIRTEIVVQLCRAANYEEAASLIKDFAAELERTEGKNAVLLVENGCLFSRLCGKNGSVLSETYQMVDKAVQLAPTNADYITELGDQCILQGKHKEALRFFKSATKLDDSCTNALLGMTLCELKQNGKSEQIKHQVEFLLELQETDLPSLLLFMKAKLLDDKEDCIKFLNDASDKLIDFAELHPYSCEYLRLLNPDLLLELIREYLQYLPQSHEMESSDKSLHKTNPVITKVERLLRVLTKACPGLLDAFYLFAKVKYLKGDTLEAMNSLQHIVDNIDATYSEAYLLLAQIQVNIGLFDRAAQNLEIGLSYNFHVREDPSYHFINGLIEKKYSKFDEACKCFTAALNLIHARTQKLTNKRLNFDVFGQIALFDLASVYIELIDAHVQLNQVHEATKLLQDAVDEFRGTAEDARFMIISADHAVRSGDVQGAIDMLGKIKSHEPYYVQAKTKLAEIFLKCRSDQRAYLKSYQELVDSNPGPESYILLGNAYMKILEPDDALEAYDKALQMNPTDPYLTTKMGESLVTTHYFAKAVEFYKDTIKLTNNPDLKMQLANLYMDLGQFDKAEMLLVSEIESEQAKKVDDRSSLQFMAKLLNLLAEIYEKAGNMKSAASTYKNARDTQNRVIKQLSLEQIVIPPQELEMLIKVNVKLAELATETKDSDKAIQHYKDALQVLPNDLDVLAALAKIYMQVNKLELCQQTCVNLLKFDPENESALVMMADIAFRKVDFDMASFHFTNLLSKQPTNWTALVRLIEVMRRTGELDDVQQYLQQAEQSYGTTKKDPAFCYCTALYQWYSGNLNAALRNFNTARQDLEWGKEAIYNMIEICLNPEDEIGEQFFDNDDMEYRDSRSMALKTAERLLKELKQKIDKNDEDYLKFRILGNFLLIATKEKSNVEHALEDFITIASQESYKDHVRTILGMATAYTVLKQGQRAKTQLKRVVKSTWTFEDAEYLERCWLLLTDYYVQSAKYDMASELLKRVLQHNKACTKAYEYSGFIAEKEQLYKEAATNYDFAWKFSGKSNPAVGYKLAFNFMKCKKYAEAIDICQQVLRSNPDYPRIRKDIMDKSISNLRC